MTINLDNIGTEKQNESTMDIDQLETIDMVRLINKEDQDVIVAVERALAEIARAVDVIYETISKGGRLIYIGAGTSGRIGVLDASEWLPTFGVGEEAVVGIIAGGDHALRNPIEHAEDSEDAVIENLDKIKFSNKDILCALASSGRTPYCIGGLKYANKLGAKTISLACLKNSEIARYADYPIEAVVGQEVITGSTRMKSGSAQKMVLNILSTATMIKSGKVYGNLMVDVKPTNKKLVERAKSIIMNATKVDYDKASELLEVSENQVKYAIVIQKLNISLEESIDVLAQSEGRIADAIKTYDNHK